MLPVIYRLVDADGNVVSSWNRSNEFYTTLKSAKNARVQFGGSNSYFQHRDIHIEQAEVSDWTVVD